MRKIVIIFVLLGGCSTSYYDGPKSDHFDGIRFFNPQNKNYSKSFFDLLKWKLFSKKEKWPSFLKIDPPKLDLLHWDRSTSRAVFINHATVLIQIEGLNILTDPIWSTYTGPNHWIGARRVRDPAVAFEKLPPIDVVILSHNHYDHFDRPTLDRLNQAFHPQFLMGLGNRKYFDDWKNKKNLIELDWEQSYSIKGMEFIFQRVQHWSRRTLFDTNKALWGGFVIKGKTKKIYFAGDTGYSEHFKSSGQKYGPFHLSLIPIGHYLPRWFMSFSHLNPKEAFQAHKDLKSLKSMGIHFGTFPLTDEAVDAPVKDLQSAINSEGQDRNLFISPYSGQSVNF